MNYTVLFQSVHYFLDTLYVSSDSLIGSRHAPQIQIVYNMICTVDCKSIATNSPL